MAKKHKFPTKPCPKCGNPIHARLMKHEACGWVAAANGKSGAKHRKTKATASSGAVTMQDIEAVKALVDAMGADKVKELARVLG
jgi:hypothetical protein